MSNIFESTQATTPSVGVHHISPMEEQSVMVLVAFQDLSQGHSILGNSVYSLVIFDN